MEDCVFCKIVNKDIPTDVIYEDDTVLVFPDRNPVKPIHYLFIPKTHIEEFIKVEDSSLFAHIGSVIQKMISQADLTKNGYKITVNGGGHQEVNHLHFHLMGPIE